MPYDEAVALVRAGIQRYNHTVGSGQGYHETVTVAFVRLIDARVNRDANAGEKFPDFLARCPELVDRERPILHEYYRPETLDSDAARDSFVEPDRSPLP
ncbi:MAG: hypothetical protein K1X74_08660 [Pirellulales bacterium]|nr:hypothetical protein [Pirellulales bacterium]